MKTIMRLVCAFTLALPAFTLTSAQAQTLAQTYPTKPIRLIVPATTGGAIDIIARVIADKISAPLGQTVIVENKPGAANNLGTDYVAKSPADGYTLVIVASSHATNKFLYKALPYDPIKDFEPIVYTHVVPLVLAVNPSIPAKTVPELISWIKANPQTANYASSGNGSSLHMAAELFMNMSGTKMQHVPYRGSSAAHPDLLAGRVAMIFDPLAAIQNHVKAGTVRGIAVTTQQRSSALPDLPTIDASGLKGYEASTWGGILAPTKTPKQIVNRLNTLINAAMQMEDVKTKLAASGIQLQGGSPEAFAAVIASEIDKWGKIVAISGIQPE